MHRTLDAMQSPTRSTQTERPQPNAVVAFLRSLLMLIFTIGPGKHMFTVRQCINLHKLLIFPVYAALLFQYADFNFNQKWGMNALVLWICHTMYGVFWVYKDIYFPDPSWQTSMSPLGFLTMFRHPCTTTPPSHGPNSILPQLSVGNVLRPNVLPYHRPMSDGRVRGWDPWGRFRPHLLQHR